MRLLFKQRLFSWFDSYDIYDAQGNAVFTVQGRLAWGHKLEIYDPYGNRIGMVREEVLTLLPRFEIFVGDHCIGEIKREFTLFKPRFTLNCNGWTVDGDIWGWDYRVVDGSGQLIMQATKQLFNWTDTYVMDIVNPQNQLLALMIVLAIDAAKCSQK